MISEWLDFKVNDWVVKLSTVKPQLGSYFFFKGRLCWSFHANHSFKTCFHNFLTNLENERIFFFKPLYCSRYFPNGKLRVPVLTFNWDTVRNWQKLSGRLNQRYKQIFSSHALPTHATLNEYQRNRWECSRTWEEGAGKGPEDWEARRDARGRWGGIWRGQECHLFLWSQWLVTYSFHHRITVYILNQSLYTFSIYVLIRSLKA